MSISVTDSREVVMVAFASFLGFGKMTGAVSQHLIPQS